jgi:hypothetical protein
VDQRKFFLSYLPGILEIFFLKWANPSLYLSIASTDILIKPSLMSKRGKEIFYLSSKAECVTFFWLDIVSEGSDHFLLCSGSHSPGCPIHIKEEFSASALRHSQNSCKFQVNTYILPLFFMWHFLQQHLKFLLIFFHMICMSQWDRRKIISILE